MNYLYSLFTILILLLFSSCDPALKVKYEVINKTTKPINVKFQFVFNRSGDTSMQVVTIAKNDSKILNEEDGLGYINQFNQRRDSVYIYQLSIEQGNKRTNVNFKDKKYWILKKNGDQEGVYQLFFDTTFLGKLGNSYYRK